VVELRAERPGFSSRHRMICFFATTSIPAPRLIHPHLRRVPGFVPWKQVTGTRNHQPAPRLRFREVYLHSTARPHGTGFSRDTVYHSPLRRIHDYSATRIKINVTLEDIKITTFHQHLFPETPTYIFFPSDRNALLEKVR
jgi:hypothetical protein